MTFDLLVVTRLEPTSATVEACLRDIGWKLSLSGELGGARDNLMAEERGFLRRRARVHVGRSPSGRQMAGALGPTAEAHPRGLLVRLGPAPLDADQLNGLMPALPPELVFDALPDQPAGRPVVRVPARHIPEVVP